MVNVAVPQARPAAAAISDLRVAIFYGLLAFFSFVWLSPQAYDNAQVKTRMGLVFSIVERNSLNIDQLGHLSIDKAKIGDHYYADKVPGHPLLAVPVIMLAEPLLKASGQAHDSSTLDGMKMLVFIATIAVNGVISAIAVAVFYLTLLRIGAGRQSAVFATFALAVGSPFFGWSTAFFAHSLTASFLIFGLGLLSLAHTPPPTWLSRRPFLLAAAFGLLAGIATTTDLVAGPIFALLGLVLFYMHGKGGAKPLLQVAIGGVVGAVIGILPLLIYNYLAFQNPFLLAYSNVVGFEGMQEGFFGLTVPDPAVAFELLFGFYRGIFPLAPILLVGFVGLYFMLRKAATRLFGVLIVVAFLYFLAMNASYHYWDGGWSTGPRHLVPMVPFLAMGLAFAWPASRPLQIAVLLILFVSLVMSLVSASVGMFAPDLFPNEIVDFLFRFFPGPYGILDTLGMIPVWIIFGWKLFSTSRSARPIAAPAASI